ncbi:MAG: class I SAM-dependent methyltransferase [Blastocatellia bacterium]|nr:class I SAM-dependent methyltransferase [Blastocatellia bacterium]
MDEWYEDESFWIELYPILFSDERFDLAEEQVEKVLKLAGFEGGAVLDLCCGPGRHTIAIAKRGIKVTAVDRTEFFLNKAKESASNLGLQVEFVLEDMRNFIRPGVFDLVLNMFTSFGYFDDKEDDFKVLRNIHESLKPGGTFLIDMMGKEILASVFQPTVSSQREDGSLIVERREIFDNWSRIRNEWILIRDGKAKSFKFHHTLYSGQELKSLIERAGFGETELFGDLYGNEYGPDATRLIVVAHKAD